MAHHLGIFSWVKFVICALTRLCTLSLRPSGAKTCRVVDIAALSLWISSLRIVFVAVATRRRHFQVTICFRILGNGLFGKGVEILIFNVAGQQQPLLKHSFRHSSGKDWGTVDISTSRETILEFMLKAQGTAQIVANWCFHQQSLLVRMRRPYRSSVCHQDLPSNRVYLRSPGHNTPLLPVCSFVPPRAHLGDLVGTCSEFASGKAKWRSWSWKIVLMAQMFSDRKGPIVVQMSGTIWYAQVTRFSPNLIFFW